MFSCVFMPCVQSNMHVQKVGVLRKIRDITGNDSGKSSKVNQKLLILSKRCQSFN